MNSEISDIGGGQVYIYVSNDAVSYTHLEWILQVYLQENYGLFIDFIIILEIIQTLITIMLYSISCLLYTSYLEIVVFEKFV